MELPKAIQVRRLYPHYILILFWISGTVSNGSPWDWQGGNVRYSTVQTDSAQELPNDSDPISLEVTTNVTVFEGETVHLPCRVRNLGEYTVSWMRGRDMSVVSVGHVTFSSDKRYHVVHVPRPRLNAADWNLEIKDVTEKDSGWYDCQVNTEPKISNKSYLVVQPRLPWMLEGISRKLQDAPARSREMVSKPFSSTTDPFASISGPPMIRMPIGHILTLECTLSRLPSPPSDFFWTHNEAVITPKDRSGVSLESEKLAGVSHSKIVIVDLKPEDAGTYACVSDLAPKAQVQVVIDSADDHSEALASRVSSSSIPPSSISTLLFISGSIAISLSKWRVSTLERRV